MSIVAFITFFYSNSTRNTCELKPGKFQQRNKEYFVQFPRHAWDCDVFYIFSQGSFQDLNSEYREIAVLRFLYTQKMRIAQRNIQLSYY